MNSEKLYGIHYSTFAETEMDYIEVAWNRKLTECGDFSVYMPAEKYNADLKYVRLGEGNNRRPETGVIQKIQYDEKANGDFITLSGKFLHGLLNWASSIFTYTINDKTPFLNYLYQVGSAHSKVNSTNGTTIYEFIHGGSSSNRDNAAFYKLVCEDPTFAVLPSFSSDATCVERGTGMCDAVYQVLSQFERCGFYSEILQNPNCDGEHGPFIGHTLKFFQGENLASTVQFSRSAGNVSELSYTRDESGVFNDIRAYIDTDKSLNADTWWKGSDTLTSEKYSADDTGATTTGNDGQDVLVRDVLNTSNGIEKMGGPNPTMVVSAQTEKEIKQANRTQIRADVYSSGNLEMLNHWVDYDITATVLQNGNYLYLRDYDLGDKVQIVLEKINITATAVVTEVSEVHSQNHCEVDVTIGTPRKI